MENKSPFGMVGSEFDDLDHDSNNESEAEVSSDKKKKNKVSEIWKKLFNRESDEPNENQKSFTASFSSLFGKLIGLEKESKEDDQASQEFPEESRAGSFHLPLANTTEVGYIDDGALSDRGDRQTEDNLVQYDSNYHEDNNEVTVLHDQDIDQTVIADTITEDVNSVLAKERRDYDDIEDVQHLSDVDVYEPLPLPSDMVNDEIENKEHQQEMNNYNEAEVSDRERQHYQDINTGEEKEPNVKEEPESVAVPHHSNYADKDALHREQQSRRRLKKQTHKLRKRIDDLHSKQESHQKSIESIQKQEQNQGAELLAMGKKELYVQKEGLQKSSIENRSERTGTIFRTKHTARPQKFEESNIYHQAKGEIYGKQTLDRQKANENSRYLDKEQEYSNQHKRSNEHSAEVEQTTVIKQNPNELQIINESAVGGMLDRKIEAKDSDERFQTTMKTGTYSGSGQHSEGTISSEYSDSRQISSTKRLESKISVLERHQQESLKAMDEYRKAIKTGINTGIIMLVSLGLVAFIWSLLN